MNLNDLIASSAKDMQNQLERIRTAASHAGLKGTAAEEILAKFLRERLPVSLGVTTGQVVDRDGNLSKQADVVIYDATRTPILFSSPGASWDIIPAEGVLAVIEVKMHLTSSHLSEVGMVLMSAAGEHRVKVLTGHRGGRAGWDKAVDGVGSDALGGVDGGGVAELDRGLDVRLGKSGAESVGGVGNGERPVVGDLGDVPAVAVGDPVGFAQRRRRSLVRVTTRSPALADNPSARVTRGPSRSG